MDVAKTADGQTVLARTSWGHHDSIGCYLSIDDQALSALRAAPPPQSLPEGRTTTSLRCFTHHQFGELPVDVAKTVDGQTVLARLSWNWHDTIGCYLVLDDTALATLQAAHTGLTDTGPTDTGTPEASPQFTPVAAGDQYSCAIKTDQTVACWGDNFYGQTEAPDGQYTAIAAGDLYSCAIKIDQTITCWGDNTFGRTDAPDGQYTAIANGRAHSCAIKTDQTITCWGNNTFGRTDAPDGQYTAIANGGAHSCAIKTDQTITCWGYNREGQTGAPDGRYTAIAASVNHSCAISADQSIVCWGNNVHGQADAPPGPHTAIATGGTHSCAIKNDQTIACWGRSQEGQIDAPDGQYAGVAANDRHSCAIRADQTVTCWGDNQNRQTSVPLRVRKLEKDILEVRMALESDPAASTDQQFELAIDFTRAVTGFVADDITVVNGDVTNLSGSGSEFRATVRASFPGNVVMWVGRSTVQDLRGNSNEPSQPLVAKVGQTTTNSFDTWDRDAVLADFAAEFDRQEPDPGWTGNLARCIAGTTSQEYRDSIFQRMNWYRQMAGILPIAEDPELSSTAQAKALIMAAEGRLSHRPNPNWACYTRVEFSAESLSNISGINSINLYMQDPGPNNIDVGHRRMIISRRLGPFGTGDIPDRANALHARISNGQKEVREQRGFVAWPPPGYIPYPAVWGRWSFTLPNADFSNATVAVVDNEGPVEAQIIYDQPVAEPGIVWAMDGDEDSDRHARPSDDYLCYTVAITGVQIDGATQPPYEYATCVTDDPRRSIFPA
ncbi:Ig-like domain-containing protein [Candidatus Poriferisocius sp.]|uniref:Ig-like domain-containing protein n=1 Tax=Candidatus Poriferisocius sp. TaxID=3101276 RepID=UPI003B024579